MKTIPTFAFCLAMSATSGQSPVVGIDIRGSRYFTSTADANFVANFVSPAPYGGNSLWAIDYDASATTLWGVSFATSEYGTIDPLTGAFTPLGVIGGGIPTLSINGLAAAPDGTTWFLTARIAWVSTLFVGDITTGTFSRVGPITGTALVIDIAMSSTGRLIGHDVGPDALFDIDPSTGFTTLIGPHGLNAGDVQGMDFDWSTDTLYAAIYTGFGTGQFCSVDLTTGAATSLVATTPLDAQLVLAIQVPAPSTDIIQPGSDLWITPGANETREDFGAQPIPPGFFGPGSDPFTGTIFWRGEPLTGTGLAGGVDTIVQRMAPADMSSIGNVAAIPIEIAALALRSVEPITVTFGGTSTSRYDARATLSTNFPQQQGSLQMQRTQQDGGQFQSFLPVTPQLQFTKVFGVNGDQRVVADFGQQILMQNPTPGNQPACWSFDNGGFNLVASPGGVVDHDGNPATPPRPYLPTSANYHVGICPPAGPSCPPQIRLTREEEMLAVHGVLPVRIPMLVGSAFCEPANPNSTGCPAWIDGLGSARVIDDDFSLEARGMPFNSFGFFLASRTALLAPIIPVGSQGRLCIGPSIGRGVGGVIFNSSPTGSAKVIANLNAMPQPTGPVVVLPGDTWHFQGWHRDGNPGVTSNMTNGLRVLFR